MFERSGAYTSPNNYALTLRTIRHDYCLQFTKYQVMDMK